MTSKYQEAKCSLILLTNYQFVWPEFCRKNKWERKFCVLKIPKNKVIFRWKKHMWILNLQYVYLITVFFAERWIQIVKHIWQVSVSLAKNNNFSHNCFWYLVYQCITTSTGSTLYLFLLSCLLQRSHPHIAHPRSGIPDVGKRVRKVITFMARIRILTIFA